MKLAVMTACLLACGTGESKTGSSGSASAAPSAADSPADERAKKIERMIGYIHSKTASEKQVTITVEGPVLILDTKGKAEECRAMSSSV